MQDYVILVNLDNKTCHALARRLRADGTYCRIVPGTTTADELLQAAPNGVLWMLDPTHIIIDCVYARTREKQFIAAVEKHLTLHFADETRILPQIFPTAPGLSSVVRGAVCVLQRAWLERILM